MSYVVPSDNPLGVPSFVFDALTPNFYWKATTGLLYGHVYSAHGPDLLSAVYQGNYNTPRFIFAFPEGSTIYYKTAANLDPSTVPTDPYTGISTYTYDGKTVYYVDNNITESITTVDTNAPKNPGVNIYDYRGQAAWLMFYGGYTGFSVTYDLYKCVGDPGNPTTIQPNATITTAYFTADPGYYFTRENTIIYGTGTGPEGGVVFVFDLATGEMRIGPITSDIIIKITCTGDPYGPGGSSGPGGGGGTFDFTSTDIPVPPLPTIGAYDTGFISLYRPSDSELRALAAYLWSGPFDLDNFKKIFANPMDCILGLHIIPTAGAHPMGAASALMVGNISTGLSMTRLIEQYYELDCGTITIDPKWGAYLDYAPYSKLSLFLPYIGFVTISPDDCMNGSIRVVYHVDVLSGSCCAYVYCASNQGSDGHTLYTFTGGCACDCPVTEGQYTNGLFGSLRGGIGLAAGLLSESPAGVMGGIEEAANAALSMVKPDVGRSGSFGGSAGLMGIQYPYLVLTIPKMCTPGDQNIYKGYPSFVTKELGDITGYASVEVTHMENMSATDDEVAEIMGLLGEGVIF